MNPTAPETKSLSPDVAAAFDDFMRTNETFRQENDERLKKLDQRDVLVEEKLSRLDIALSTAQRVMDDLAVKAQRPQFGATGTARNYADREHKAAFEGYMRKGDATALQRYEAKALSATSSPDGGYTVPIEIETTINHSLRAISPIRQIAGNKQVSTTIYTKPISTGGFPAGWVGETDPIAQTASAQIAQMPFQTMELYAMPAATQQLLDDSVVNIDQWIADEVRITFAQQEGAAFINGNGTNQPKGFLTYPTVAQSNWSFGNLGYVATGTAGAFPATSAFDTLMNLLYAVKAGYRVNGSFVMNRNTVGLVRKMKDQIGDYLWEPSTQPGVPSTLLGYPVIEAEDMPDIAAGSLSIAFGDFQRGYLVVDRMGIRVLRDPYSAKPYVLFYTTKRVGGGIQDFDAIKLLSFSAS